MVKLRTACDHCHASKVSIIHVFMSGWIRGIDPSSFQVRCSGEKDGCKRCQNLDHECVYSESRVGKVPGIRNRNKRTRPASEQPTMRSPVPTELSTRESSKEPGADASYFPLFDDSFLDWPRTTDEPSEPYDHSAFDSDAASFVDFQDSDSSLHLSSYPSPNFPASCADFDFKIPPLSFPIDGLHTPPMNEYDHVPMPASYAKNMTTLHRQHLGLLNLPTPKASTAPPTRTSSPSLCEPQPPASDSRGCISACNEIIEYLDSQIHSDLTALDSVMRVNKTAVTELSRILTLPDCRSSASCPLLMCIAADQIVTLFECSIRSSDGLPGAHTLHAMPDLRFGFFPVDPEEMVALRAHVITKELRRSLQVLETLHLALRNPALQSVPSVSLHKQWTIDMAHRLRGLVGAVGCWRMECLASLGKK